MVTACDAPILHSSINSGRSCGDILLTNPPGSSNWLASMDGTAARLLTTDTGPALMDLLTGTLTPLPVYDDELENPRGIISSDGTIFLYGFNRESDQRLARMAIFLRRGDMAWTQVCALLNYLPHSQFYFSAKAAHHDGKILVVCADVTYWCILTPDNYGVTRRMELPRMPYDECKCRLNNHFLEFQGQLLLVSVMVNYHHHDPTQMLSLVVHGLEEDEMRWVVRDGASLGDQAVFLGSRASFTMDAAELGVDGGCAYFIFRHDVFRYNFFDGDVMLIDNLPPAWPANTVRDMYWLLPQPKISSIQEIRKRLGLQ
ncbi:hypothetical protein VPH35_126230 [Triticum aestivum]